MTGFLASLKDFSCTDGGEVDPNVVVENPQISLYCFDDIDRQAIFVELPADVDLTKAPFVYQSQYENAQRLIAVPYETFNQLAKTLPEIQQPIFIYITGRSGSTLLSHVFNDSNVVASLSEPDVATQFLHLRHSWERNRTSELHRLAQNTMRFLFKSYHARGIQTHALKFRSEGLQVMDLFQSAFPQAKNLFLYRDAIGWATSFYRLLKSDGIPEYSPVSFWQSNFETIFTVDFSHFRQYLDDGCEQISIPEALALWWIASTEWYLAQVERGIPVLAVRYADIIQHREEVLGSIFNYCDLPVSGMQLGLSAFDRDSQAGTKLARENSNEGNMTALSEEQLRSVSVILERHPILNTSDYIVPETLRI